MKRDPIIIWQSVVAFAPRESEGAERWQYSLAIRFEPFTLKRGVKTAKFSCTHWHGSSIKCRRVIQHEFTLGRIAQDLTVKKIRCPARVRGPAATSESSSPASGTVNLGGEVANWPVPVHPWLFFGGG